MVRSHSWASRGTLAGAGRSPLCLGEAHLPGRSRGQNPSLLDLSVGQSNHPPRPALSWPPGRPCLGAGGLCARRVPCSPRACLHTGASRAPGPALREIDAAKRAFNGLIDRRLLSCSNTRFLPGEAASPVLYPVDGGRPGPSRPRVSSTSHRQKSISPLKLRHLATFLLSGRLKQGNRRRRRAARAEEGRLPAARTEDRGRRARSGEADFAGGGTASQGGGRPR